MTTLPITLETFVSRQAERLIREGWDVSWISADRAAGQILVPDGVSHLVAPFKRGVDLVGPLKAIAWLYRIFVRERFDIVQFSTPNAAFYASTAALLARVPVRIYAQWGVRYVGLDGFPRRIMRLLEAWTCRCATIIQPDSRSNLEFSVREGLYSRGKGRVIWNGSACGVDLDRFRIDRKMEWRKDYRSMLGIEQHEFVIGFVGSVRRDKGCNELLEATRRLLREVPEGRLLMIGDTLFVRDLRRDLVEWARADDRVLFVPPSHEIPKYMSCMDVLALPSYREGFGLVVVEAQAMGVPVVVSDVPGPVDAMLHGKTGLSVPVRDSVALEDALRELHGCRELRITMAHAATRFARKNFDQKEFLDRVVRDKEELLLDGAGSGRGLP